MIKSAILSSIYMLFLWSSPLALLSPDLLSSSTCAHCLKFIGFVPFFFLSTAVSCSLASLLVSIAQRNAQCTLFRQYYDYFAFLFSLPRVNQPQLMLSTNAKTNEINDGIGVINQN